MLKRYNLLNYVNFAGCGWVLVFVYHVRCDHQMYECPGPWWVLKCFLATAEVCAFCLGRSGKGREKGKPGMNLGLLSFAFLCDSESCVIPYLQVRKRKLRINYCFSHFLNGTILASITLLNLC